MGAGAPVSSDSDRGAVEFPVFEGRTSGERCVSEGSVAFGGGPAFASVPVPALGSAPATALAASPLRSSGSWALEAAASASGGSGALLVARSTVTLRTGSGALTGSLAPTGAGAGPGGPDSSSGTINTMSTTKIDAPTRRSLTRRSIELVSLELKCLGASQYIREARPVAARRAPRANPGQAL